MASSAHFDMHPRRASSADADSPSSLVSPEEVANRLGISAETLAQWRSQERGIPYVKISRNCIRYRASDLEVWLEERTVRVPQEPSGSRRRI